MERVETYFGHFGAVARQSHFRRYVMHHLCLMIAASFVGGEPAELKLPTGDPPIQILARMTEQGFELVIPYYEYKREDLDDGKIQLVPVKRKETRNVSLKDVHVYGTDGMEVDRKRLSKMLQKPTLALCTVDGKPVDPLHLRLVKDGTLIFVGPTPKAVKYTLEP